VKPGDPAPTRVGFISLGCAKNLVDTEVMSGRLAEAGFRFVRDHGDAELIVVNTCAFIGAAREESIGTILEMAELKRHGNLKRLVVAGCMVQRYREELQRDLPEVDAFVNLDELDLIVERSKIGGPTPALLRPTPTADGSTYLYDHETPRLLATPPWSAYIKIAEGCDHQCSFCAIPAIRGSFRSREPASVVREARTLVAGGARELILIAQDSSRYGRDLGIREGLSDLLERLQEIENLCWIRLLYLYPNSVSENLISTMAGLSKVVEYVDLPLQHAAPALLSRMRRGGSADSHLRLIESFRRAMPDAAIRSTFIVGFPGESEEDFEELLEFMRRARFDHLGVFTYSHEEGTAAQGLIDDVPAGTKQDRYDRAMAYQQEIVFARNRELVGSRVELLLEGAHPETEHLLVGRMSTQAPEVDGQVLVNDGQARPGRFVRAELTDVAGYDLVGRIIEEL
jgi:ribosomal protein S12 methylthiotransferase